MLDHEFEIRAAHLPWRRLCTEHTHWNTRGFSIELVNLALSTSAPACAGENCVIDTARNRRPLNPWGQAARGRCRAGRDLGAEMVSAGMAWASPATAPTTARQSARRS